MQKFHFVLCVLSFLRSSLTFESLRIDNGSIGGGPDWTGWCGSKHDGMVMALVFGVHLAFGKLTMWKDGFSGLYARLFLLLMLNENFKYLTNVWM